jgi:hypothetical protein
MDTDKWYVFTKEELQDLLLNQRRNCAEVVTDICLDEYDPNSILDAREPELPNPLSEWKVVNKITSGQK